MNSTSTLCCKLLFHFAYLHGMILAIMKTTSTSCNSSTKKSRTYFDQLKRNAVRVTTVYNIGFCIPFHVSTLKSILMETKKALFTFLSISIFFLHLLSIQLLFISVLNNSPESSEKTALCILSQQFLLCIYKLKNVCS